MKFQVTLAAALALGAQAQIQTVQTVLSDVQSDINSLDTTVKGYSGDSKPLVDGSQTLVSTINDGNSKVKGIKELSLADALSLQDPVKDLTDAATTLVNDITAKRSAIASDGNCGTAREQIGDISGASNTLINTVISKVPDDAQSIADGLVADLKAVLQKAQTNFNEQNCVDSGNGGGDKTTTGGSAPTSTEGGAAPTSTEGGAGGSPTDGGAGPTATGGDSTPTASSGGLPVSNGPTTFATASVTAGGPPAGNGTSPTPPVVTGGAAALIPAGALALGVAVLVL